MSQVPAEIIRQAATRRNAVAVGAADGLALAAAPTFAIMALLTGVSRAVGPAEMLCPAAHVARRSAMKSGRECPELADTVEKVAG
jgi:hypothetical protein